MLRRLDLIEVRRDLLLAAGLIDPGLRSLDAIHVATAVTIAGDLESFVTYDRGQAGAAEDSGLSVLAPGR